MSPPSTQLTPPATASRLSSPPLPTPDSSSHQSPKRTALPTLPRSHQPRPTKKVCLEKQRGEKLDTDGLGVDATRPCTRCHKSGRTCRVARDPISYNSFKCGACISTKCSCSFSINNPGADYTRETLDTARQREEQKAVSRQRAMDARNKKKEEEVAEERLEIARILLSLREGVR
ncbi:hypothetical protein ANO14919_143940 [Xylariales sp. No.14919]|nr:hypothetical protein ANO14919_143940 [Xylariales sp. No.14919]